MGLTCGYTSHPPREVPGRWGLQGGESGLNRTPMVRNAYPCYSRPMTTSTKTAGYPVHAVAEFTRWTNPHGARFTNWVAQCGANGTLSGHDAFGLAGSARRAELCAACFPGRHWNGAKYGDPKEVQAS